MWFGHKANLLSPLIVNESCPRSRHVNSGASIPSNFITWQKRNQPNLPSLLVIYKQAAEPPHNSANRHELFPFQPPQSPCRGVQQM